MQSNQLPAMPKSLGKGCRKILSGNLRKWPSFPWLRHPTNPKDSFIWGRTVWWPSWGASSPWPGCTVWTQPVLPKCFPVCPTVVCEFLSNLLPRIQINSLQISACTLSSKFLLLCLATRVSCLLWEALSGCPRTSVTTQSLESCQRKPLGS